MIEHERIKLPGEWSLRKLLLVDQSEWALQYMGMDWIKISEFLPQTPPGDSLDIEIRKFAAAMNRALGDSEAHFPCPVCSVLTTPKATESQAK